MATRVRVTTTCAVALALVSRAASAEPLVPPAYRSAAQAAEVPARVLFAVALQESGYVWRGRFVPWPWTLNVAGEPQRFATRAEACSTLQRALKRWSATRIDAGLGQLNVGYQGHRVGHACELLDPYQNLKIAATILREHHTAGHDWLVAVGRYHRPAEGEPAMRYRQRVAVHLIRLGNAPSPRAVVRGERP